MIKKIILLLFTYTILTTNVFSAGSSGGDGAKKLSSYDSAVNRIKKAKKYEKKGKEKKAKKMYNEALKYLYKANKEKPFDPDTLNYLGFANRKIDNIKDAEIYYLMGLEIDPKHNGINEYLGELYVYTDRHNLAVERLEVLKSCNCEEYEQLKAVIAGEASKY
jgi:tetratricopeptide (TPR) repeat protein|tara:strand:+ start:141 stop:629 length:489 start_codon:yes stop_codon:yes gene_type:complete